MTQSPVYDEFLAYTKQTTALEQVGGILSWDQEVMMPPKGADARAEQAAILEACLHQRRTDPKLGDWLAQLQDAELDDVARRNVELTRRSYEQTVRIPSKLAEELARVTARAQGIWAKARAENRFADFSGVLSQIIGLKREEASCLATTGQSHYDALLDGFEPHMDVARLEPLLEGMRDRLLALRENIAASQVSPKTLEGPFDTKAQMKLARKIADNLGYDWEAGRLDLSTHPFSSGTGGDSRITTRVDEAEPLGCLYSTIHEIGHALYEQGMPVDHALTPVGQHVSMGVHESQSRLWENQIGRSHTYCEWLYPHFVEAFGTCGTDGVDDFYRAINQVETGYIRTESDEVHYNLHVLLRFELERDLIGGGFQVEDLENEWNLRFKRDFGVEVPDAAHGVLQDVHWSVGLFGYFPTYSLGNIYAGQLNVKMRNDLPTLDDKIRIGETGEALQWLRENIHHKASLDRPAKTIENAVGESVSAEPLLAYLENKFGELYKL